MRLLNCSSVHVDYLNENIRETGTKPFAHNQFLFHTVNFPTNTLNVSCTADYNIYVDNTWLRAASTISVLNGLSNLNEQTLKINNIL
jgi:hypothetical protein